MAEKKKVEHNPAQKQAIAHLNGPMMVLAGPGSGKTSVIVERTLHMLEEGIPPRNILVVTFSRMAAGEMKERFLSHTGEEKTLVTFGTFHGVFYGILKAAYGLGSGNIATQEEKEKLIRQLLLESGNEQMLEGDLVADILKEISEVKNGRLDLNYYHSLSCPDQVFHQIVPQYLKHMQNSRKLDFDDLLLECYRLFLRRPDILEAWRERFSYILVDEFQDINPLQYDIIRLLAAPKDNLFIVGDDDQSIYRFRGARPEIMLGFERDYPKAKRVLLDVNYRCTKNILETAMEVIGHNKARFPKALSTPNPEGKPVGVRIYPGMHEEYVSLSQLLKKRLEKGERLEDTAILFRTNQEVESLVGRLMDEQVPFIMREHLPNLYSHWICRDILAYLEMAQGPITRGDFLQVMNRPNRYLSRDSVSCASVGVPLPPSQEIPSFLPKKDRYFCIDLQRLMDYYRDKDWMQERIYSLQNGLALMKSMPPFAMINLVRKTLGYDLYLQEYARFRHMSVEDLFSILDQIQDSARGLSTLESWKEHIEQYTRSLEQQAKRQELNREGVTLSTLHASKGLEFDRVFIVNVNEAYIPYRKAVLEEAIEEERRLFYVGMTRAKKELSLCLIKHQGEKKMEVSRFLAEAGYV